MPFKQRTIKIKKDASLLVCSCETTCYVVCSISYYIISISPLAQEVCEQILKFVWEKIGTSEDYAYPTLTFFARYL